MDINLAYYYIFLQNVDVSCWIKFEVKGQWTNYSWLNPSYGQDLHEVNGRCLQVYEIQVINPVNDAS